MIERDARTYKERKDLHLATLSGAILYQMSTKKKWLPQVEVGGMVGYDLQTQHILKGANWGLHWSVKQLDIGVRGTYYLEHFTDQQHFLKLQPYHIGLSVGYRLR